MTRYKLQTYQFGIVSGIRQDISDRISSALPGNLFAPEARKGQLFVLTEAVNDSARGKEACDLVAKIITTTYYKDSSFSITSSLRNALKVANTTLYEHNYKAAHHQKTAVSLTCAVLRDNDLYIAQVQPTQAYIAHKGQLRAMPTYPSWQPGASSPSMMPPNALGTSLFSEPELFRNVVEPGDEIVLCSSRLARVLGRAEAERLFCLEDAPSALEELYGIARRNTLGEAHAALIELLPLVTTSTQPLSPEGLSERGKAAASVVGEWISDVTANAALTLRRHDNGESAEEPEAEPQPVSAISEPPTLPPDLEEIDPRDMGWLRERPRARNRPSSDIEMWPPSAFLGETSMTPALSAALGRQVVDLGDQEPLPVDFAAIPQRDPIEPPSLGYRITAPLRYVMAAIVTFLANVGRGRRPSASPLPRFESSRGGLSYRREKRRRFPILAVLLLVAAVATTYLWVKNTTLKNAEQRYQDALNVASSQLGVANSAPTDEEALKALSDLDLTLVNIKEDSGFMGDALRKTQYERIRRDADALSASIKRTSPLSDIEVVATLPLSDTIGQLLALPQGPGTALYFIARENGTLYRQTEGSSGAPEVVLKEGESIPPIVTRRMRAMVWREGALAAIDDEESSTIYLSQPEGGWIAQRLDGSEFWPTEPFPDIETFGGSLYVLPTGPDSEGAILKYNSGEYANLPTPWVSNVPPEVDLSTTVDMVIDGKIYLLQPDGAIEVLEAGQHLQTLPAPQLDPPLRASKMFLTIEKATETSPNLGHFYVLDTFNSRIVELDMQGAVIQQLTVPRSASARLPQVTDLAVVLNGAAGKRIYLADGDQVLSATLPAPPPPRQIVPTANPAQATPTP